MGAGEASNRQIKVKVNHLTKKFGDLLVLDDISFDVEKGDLLCVVGPTGCGKTTFLNSLTKIYDVTSGEILLDGHPADPKKDHIAYIFQGNSTMPWLTVEENVAFGLRIKKKPEAEIKESVDEVIEMVGLQKFRNYYPSQLSASMLQRVVIARAFATKPDILLMDEPYGQLDIELRFKLEDELIGLWKKLGTTIIFITHNIEEAVYISEDILILTNKPTTIKQMMANPLSRPRVVTEKRFIEVREQVTELIKWW